MSLPWNTLATVTYFDDMYLELSTRAEKNLQISEKFQLKNLCLSSRLKTFQNPKQKNYKTLL
jgi:hypothetical protein